MKDSYRNSKDKKARDLIDDAVSIIFVENLKTDCEAICLWQKGEIQIDSSYMEGKENNFMLNDILKHELKHYRFFKSLGTEGTSRRRIETSIHSLWDFLDCVRLEYLRFLKKLAILITR